MTYCTCWMEYPNKAHKKSNGKWLCVDKYKCVRPLEYKKVGTIDMPYRKTKCERIEIEKSGEE